MPVPALYKEKKMTTEYTGKKVLLKNGSGEYLFPYTDMSGYYTKTEVDALIEGAGGSSGGSTGGSSSTYTISGNVLIIG